MARTRNGNGVRIQDVAARAGVSVGTVSHTINHPELVSPRTRRAVERAIKALGFVPNQQARVLTGLTSQVIGLIVLFGLSGIFSALAAMAISPFGGFILLLSSIASVVVGVVFSRIAAEFVLIVFRINEHLGAIRDQGGMR